MALAPTNNVALAGGLQLFQEVAYNYANGTDDGTSAGNTIEINTTHDSYNIITAGVSNMIEAIHTNDSNLEDWTLVLVPKCYASLFKRVDIPRYKVEEEGMGE